MILDERLTDTRKRNQKRMLLVLAITVSYMLVELVAALFTKSLALLADAGHMLTDVGAIVLGLIAFWFAGRPATEEKTFGYYRSEILAGLLNTLILVAVSLSIIAEAWHRLQTPQIISPLPVFFIAVLGLVINLVCLRLLKPEDLNKAADNISQEHSMNVRAAHLELFGDAIVSCGVIISSLAVLFTGWYKADALVSLLVGLFILPRTWVLLSECINVLMEGTPEHIDLKSLKESMLLVEGVLDAHDIHVWTITSGLHAMSAHVLISKEARLDQVLDMVTKVLQEKFGLNHTTIQVERASCQTRAKSCS